MSGSENKRLQPLAGLPPDKILVSEIYTSLQGESSYMGAPCVLVRTTACNLRCHYCDTKHAFTGGEVMSVDAVVARVEGLGLRLVAVTGGEPLLQPGVLPLMARLCDSGHTVLLETGGSLDVRPVDPRVVKILDLKTPSSGEVDANRWDNVEALLPHDQVKLVVGDRCDYEWARAQIARLDLAERCSVLVGPVFGALEPKELASWILEDHLPVRLQLQLHKVVWGPNARGV